MPGTGGRTTTSRTNVGIMSYSSEDIEKFKTERFYPKSKRAKDVKNELGYFGLGGDQKYNRVKRLVADVCRRAEDNYTQSRDPGSSGSYWNPTDGSSVTDEMKLYEEVERATSIPRFYIPWFINNHLRGIGRIHNPRGNNNQAQQPSSPRGQQQNRPSPTGSEEAVSPVSPTNDDSLASMVKGTPMAAVVEVQDSGMSFSQGGPGGGDGRLGVGSRSANFWDTVLPDPRRQG